MPPDQNTYTKRFVWNRYVKSQHFIPQEVYSAQHPFVRTFLSPSIRHKATDVEIEPGVGIKNYVVQISAYQMYDTSYWLTETPTMGPNGPLLGVLKLVDAISQKSHKFFCKHLWM